MKTIWKYLLSIEDEQEIEIPSPAMVLCVQTQNHIPCIWCLVDPEMGLIKKKFRLVGTGWEINNSIEDLKYIGTTLLLKGMIVYHLFEILT